MKVSLSLSKFYGNVDLTKRPIDELVERIGSQLGAVEEVVDLGQQYKGVLVARVVGCADHPDADKLRLCKIDDGGVSQDVERDESGYIQVVCGAPNVREGLLAAWLPPGVIVPSTYHKEPFVLGKREIRGVLSNGMLASSKELGISDDHEGILEVDEEVAPGTAFAQAYHLHDHVIDIENKMFTHRPDCFGVLGVYREIAGIYHQAFESPDWYASDKYGLEPEPDAAPLALEAHSELPDLVPRYVLIPMSGITVKPSPVWLQVHLMRAGIRPINNVVDITNYVMYLTGQPLHAYDYDKVAQKNSDGQARLIVRMREQSEHELQGEGINLLNGRRLVLNQKAETIVIATDNEAIGIGGIMGGRDTEVDEQTRNIILECATFDMYNIRRTSMTHGLFTDAVTRFTKGQSPLQNIRVMAKAVHEVRMLAGGKVAGQLIDDNHIDPEVLERGSLHAPVVVDSEFINLRLGLHLTPEEMALLLGNVEFKVERQDDELVVTAPFWRTDIEIPEDVVEEIGRLYGYDHLPLDLPRRDLTPALRDKELDTKSHVRDALSRAGANEVLSYSFVHGELLAKAAQNPELAFRLSNALSPDLQYYRLSLTPSLLSLVHANIKAGNGQFALFELNKVHSKTEIDAAGLPREFARIALVFAAEAKVASQSYAGAPYYQAREYLVALLGGFGLADELSWTPLLEQEFGGHQLFEQMISPFEPKRSAIIKRGDRLVGVVGEYKASVAARFKLPPFAAGFEIFGSALADTPGVHYQQLPRFPKIIQDLSLRVATNVSYGELYAFVRKQLEALRPEQSVSSLSPVDIYQRPDDPEHKQVTFRITVASHIATLKADEVNALLDRVAAKAREGLGAERI